jgi:hypothetical protein
MKNIIYLLIATVIFASCEKTESPVFTGNKTLVYFAQNSVALDVVIDDSGTVEVPVNITTLQDQDITVDVELVQNQTTAAEENFSFENSATIPAGEFFGSFTVDGVDQSVETEPELITFRITNADGLNFEETLVEVSIKQVCPLGDGADFLGEYQLEQITPIHPANGVLSFENQTVTLVNDGETEASTRRAFEAVWIAGAGIDQPAANVSFDLSCNNVVVDNDIDTFLTCDGENNITLGPADTTGSYNEQDDSSFTLILAEYVEDGGCGVSTPLTTEFSLTKVN